FVVAGTTTNTAPYSENFEGVLNEDFLPNCSWDSPTLGSTALTYTAAGTANRLPRSGSKFAAFSNSTPGTNFMYSNGIYLETGITYSASMWYQTDLTGANNWTDLSLLYGTAQNPTGLTSIASTGGPAVSLIYKPLS